MPLPLNDKEPGTEPPASPIAICTLWEKDYHKGLGVLVNSLIRAGYKGRIWAGYRGVLPAWVGTVGDQANVSTLCPANGVELKLCPINTQVHFAQYKARWMREILEVRDPGVKGIYYFDPDIMVLGKWAFFEQWLSYGVAVCEDQSYPVNPTHPLARSWQQYARDLGYSDWHPLEVYFNSGLVGVRREWYSFLSLWQDLIDAMQRDFDLAGLLKTGTRTELFHQTDQDALAVAAAISPHPISWISTDGMGFSRGEWLTIHALSKPWRRRVFRDWLVQGHRPDAALRLYWQLAGGPIRIESEGRVRRHRLYIPIAALLSRFYSRR